MEDAMRIHTEVVSSGSKENTAKVCWLRGPPDEALAALGIAVRAVAWSRPEDGVAVTIRVVVEA